MVVWLQWIKCDYRQYYLTLSWLKAVSSVSRLLCRLVGHIRVSWKMSRYWPIPSSPVINNRMPFLFLMWIQSQVMFGGLKVMATYSLVRKFMVWPTYVCLGWVRFHFALASAARLLWALNLVLELTTTQKFGLQYRRVEELHFRMFLSETVQD